MEIHMYHRQRKNKQRIRTKFSAFMMLFVFIFVLVCHIGLLNPDLTASVKTSFQDTLKGLFTNSSKQDTALSYSESRPENTTLSVTFLDVGQGNCVLAESDGHYMLIDGGDRSHSSFVVSYLQQAGITALDYVLISHYDADHVSGVIGALYQFDVGNVLSPDYSADTKIYQSYVNCLKKQNITPVHPQVGDTYILGNASFTVVCPDRYDYEEENNRSLGIRLCVAAVFKVSGVVLLTIHIIRLVSGVRQRAYRIINHFFGVFEIKRFVMRFAQYAAAFQA